MNSAVAAASGFFRGAFGSTTGDGEGSIARATPTRFPAAGIVNTFTSPVTRVRQARRLHPLSPRSFSSDDRGPAAPGVLSSIQQTHARHIPWPPQLHTP